MPTKKAAKKAPKPPVKKQAVKKTAPPAVPPAGVQANVPVRVRMYRTGLGDCFLITFDPGGDARHMLIDCGSLGSKTTGKKLSDAVADIRATTQDHLHLLVATHEHKDHVCGFRDVNEEFRKITVDNVWLAWTEDPADTLANEIAKYKGDLGTALAAAAQALTANKKDARSFAMGMAVKSLLDFAGEPEALGAAGKEGLARTIDEAMTFIRKEAGKKTRYLRPGGAAIEEDWLSQFRFYILGPPRSAAKLKDLGEHGSADIYGVAAALGASAVSRAKAAEDVVAPDETEMPFDARFRYPETDPFILQALASYVDRDATWRRVDQDWLHGSADLALQLDSLTNNTSLALAIERTSDGKVLLFPADAQEGNWLSWHDAETAFEVSEGGRPTTRTAEQLLKATVFYKVGHHGSHNATASRKGLELMTSQDELVAFIPVDRQVALGKSPQGSWRMPAPALYPKLLEKCQGRVVRSDLGWADDAKNAKDKVTEKELVGLVPAAKWVDWRKNQKTAEAKSAGDAGVRIEELFIDYVLA